MRTLCQLRNNFLYKKELLINSQKSCLFFHIYTIEENNIIQYKLQRLSEKMFEKMNLRDIARFDYLQTSNGDFYLIDANSLPSLSNNYIFEYSLMYCLSSFTTSSKSVMLLRPLTCHIPVSPGLVARRAR